MKNLIALFFILLFSLYLRAYTVSAGLPYFYDEDEAHHFNRTVNMAKSGDMNPRYFHKPSLHFYLRIPVVWISAEWSKLKGYIKDIDDIRTFNRFGVGDYAFTASHPGIVKWNRAFSLFLSLILITLTFYIALLVSGSPVTASAAAIAAGVSPPLIDYAGFIGVDVLMAVMCLTSVFLALKFIKENKRAFLIGSALFAGLAVSSKYNALPVAAVPLAACFLSGRGSLKNYLICLILPAVSFLAASPYILISIPVFIKDLGYEIWHYSVAGHEGHTAERGIPQILFYFEWFFNYALGKSLAVLALIGFIVGLIKPSKVSLVLFTFPVLYFLMMILQKANFTRNMLVIIPFLSIFGAHGLTFLLNALRAGKMKIIFLIVFLAACAEPLTLSLSKKSQVLEKRDSRNDLATGLLKYGDGREIALAGQLQLPPHLAALPNFTTIDQNERDLSALFLDGFDRVVLSAQSRRIVDDPDISIVDFDPLKFDLQQVTEKFSCAAKNAPGEDLCWIKKRFSYLILPEKEARSISFEVMSPWPGNFFGVGKNAAAEKIKIGSPPGKWETHTVKFTEEDLHPDGSLLFYVEKIYSPFKRGLSGDKRRLGLAIRNIQTAPP